MESPVKDKNIWIAFTKSRPLPGCSLDIDGCEFYFCESYVPVDTTSDPQIAFGEIIGRTRNELLAKRFELVDISNIVRFDPSQWEVVGDNVNGVHEFASSAEASQRITFSGFRSEEIEEETQYKHIISDHY